MDSRATPHVQDVIQWIISNHRADSESITKSKDLITNLVLQTEDPKFAIQRLYLLYSICEALEKEEEAKAVDFFKHLFPIPLRKNLASFISQLVSLVICLNNRHVLTATAVYIDKEQIKLSDEDMRQLSGSLAESSPLFAAILIDKGLFNFGQSKPSHISSDLLTRWLISLNEWPKDNIEFNGQPLIRYSLLGQGASHSDLHYNILEAIHKKRIRPLSNQFVIDMGTQLSQKGDDILSSKFGQILVIAVQNGLCNTLISSNQMKNNLSSLFPNNLLIKTILTMKGAK